MPSLKVHTFGAEHEWADHPLDREPPKGFGRDIKDHTIVNSNGIANDPKGINYRWGGEFNTPPTNTIQGQGHCLQLLKEQYPEATINYRSNLHLHVRVPGLKDDLAALKRFQQHIHTHLPKVLAGIVEPIPLPTKEGYPEPEEFKGAMRRYKRRKVSHQTFLSPGRLRKQLAADTVDAFFKAEPPLHSKTLAPLWACQPRVCVNLRQLLQTDTVEFRHFPGTMNKDELETCFQWVLLYTQHALEDEPINDLIDMARTWKFPTFPRYLHSCEVGYRATISDGTLSRAEVAKQVKIIESKWTLDYAREFMLAYGYAEGAK